MKKRLLSFFVLAFLAPAGYSYAGEVDTVLNNAKKEGKVVMLEIGSVGCIPCDNMNPVMEKLRANYKDKPKVLFVDVRKDKEGVYPRMGARRHIENFMVAATSKATKSYRERLNAGKEHCETGQMHDMNTEANGEFQGLYYEFYEKIRRYLNRFVGEHEAEDLTQEVFFKASRALHSFEGRAQLSTWIFRIATNAAIDKLRNKSDRNTVAGGDLCVSDADEVEWAVEQAASPEQAVIQKEMNNCIRDIVETLPENYRITLSLSELEGFSNREIAEITGVSLETVKIRLHRARHELRKRLSLQCDFYRDERNEFACDRKNGLIKFL